jgi:hypothetical protein
MIKLLLLLLPLISFAGKLQDADVKGPIYDYQIWVPTDGINKTLYDAIEDEDITIGGTSISSINIVTKTANYTVTLTDDLIVADSSGGAFTLTLPACNSDGKKLIFKKSNNELNKVTILRAGSDTIGYPSKTSVGMFTPNELWVFRCFVSSSKWLVEKHESSTDWIDYGAITIHAVTTNPQKGTTSADKVLCKRDKGIMATCRFNYAHSALGSATAGSGNYIIRFPTGYAFASQVSLFSAAFGSATARGGQISVLDSRGHVRNDTNTSANIRASAYDSTGFRIILGRDDSFTTYDMWGSAFFPINNAGHAFSFYVTFPVDGWDE